MYHAKTFTNLDIVLGSFTHQNILCRVLRRSNSYLDRYKTNNENKFISLAVWMNFSWEKPSNVCDCKINN